MGPLFLFYVIEPLNHTVHTFISWSTTLEFIVYIILHKNELLIMLFPWHRKNELLC